MEPDTTLLKIAINYANDWQGRKKNNIKWINWKLVIKSLINKQQLTWGSDAILPDHSFFSFFLNIQSLFN